MKKHNIRILEQSMLFALVFSVLLSFAKFGASCDTLRNNILRIHIIANSDGDSDQSVKLKVRDAILNFAGDIFNNCADIETAKCKANENLGEIEAICNRTLEENGIIYKASAKIGKAHFDTREYEDFTLPAGDYDSLIVTLGEAKGHNWWCVIYPSVCVGGSKEKLKKIGRDSEIATNPKKYKVRFKTVELYEKIRKIFS